LSLTPTVASGKPKKPVRFRPCRREGLNIQYRLKDSNVSLSQVARDLCVDPSIVTRVLFGLRHSARIEAEIARLLGKPGWNEVVLEARSEVQGKPVSVILKEMEQKRAAQREEAAARMADYAAENRERVGRVISEGLAAKAGRAG